MNIHDLDKEVQEAINAILEFKKRTLPWTDATDIKAWIAEEKRLIKRRNDAEEKRERFRQQQKNENSLHINGNFCIAFNEIGFRGLYRNFNILKLTKRLKSVVEDFPGANDSDYALVYGYIDHTAGFTLEILAVGCKNDDGFYFENGNNDIRSFIRIGAAKKCIFYQTDNIEECISLYSEKLEMLQGYAISEEMEKIRNMEFLDSCRNDEYPDDVLVYLFKKGYAPEGCWVRVEKIAEPGLVGVLLNEPNQDLGCHAHDMIQFGIQQLKDGRIICFSNID